MRIPAGTTTGRTFRIKGKGVRGKDGMNHDVLAVIDIAVPQNLNEEAKSALKDFADATNDQDPRKEIYALGEKS
jgi:molecular chaperone DnaJ